MAGLLLIVPGLLALGCEGGRAQPARAASADRPVVAATTTMIADLAGVLAGKDAHVVGIMKPGEDPHVYDVRPRDAQMIAGADLVLTNGLHLESTLLGVIEHNASGAVVKLAEAGGVRPLQAAEIVAIGSAAAGASGTAAAGSTGAAPDPHAWMSVPHFMAYAEAARDALIELDPEHADGYQRRARAYLSDLKELDAWVRRQWETVPPERRIIVTSHDAFNYYAQAYGVEVHGVIGISTEQQPRPQDLLALERMVRDRSVRALFIETSVSRTLNRLVAKIADRTDARIGGTLYSDSLGAPGGEAGSYLSMMRHNTRVMVDALRGVQAVSEKDG